MIDRPIILATRGSPLALAQTQLVLAECRTRFPDTLFDFRVFKTTGDRLQHAGPTAQVGPVPKGLFTKELEVALLAREADLAVHSLKDLPVELPAGLELAAVLPREDPRDVLILTAAGPSPVLCERGALSPQARWPNTLALPRPSRRFHTCHEPSWSPPAALAGASNSSPPLPDCGSAKSAGT